MIVAARNAAAEPPAGSGTRHWARPIHGGAEAWSAGFGITLPFPK
jgi:hypothetical protein